jgi:hypothetical protein
MKLMGAALNAVLIGLLAATLMSVASITEPGS